MLSSLPSRVSSALKGRRAKTLSTTHIRFLHLEHLLSPSSSFFNSPWVLPLSLPRRVSGFLSLVAAVPSCSVLRSDQRGFADFFILFFLDGFLDAGKIKIGINGEFIPQTSSSCSVCWVWKSSDWFSLRLRVCGFAQVSEGSAGSWPGSRFRARMSSWSPSTTPSSPRTTWYAPRSVAFVPCHMIDLVV